jgi:hypothetical protein
MTRQHHRCRTRKDRPVSSRTANFSVPIVHHGKGLGEISRLPTEHQTVLHSSHQSVPSLAFRRFLPSARGLRAWILPSFGLGPPVPSREQREPERLCLEVPIYPTSVSREVTRDEKCTNQRTTAVDTNEPCHSSGSSCQRQRLRSPWKDFPSVSQLEPAVQETTQS